MSETVTIRRDIEVTVYRVECERSRHGDLEFSVVAASDGDLIITVVPCITCLDDAAREVPARGETP